MTQKNVPVIKKYKNLKKKQKYEKYRKIQEYTKKKNTIKKFCNPQQIIRPLSIKFLIIFILNFKFNTFNDYLLCVF